MADDTVHGRGSLEGVWSSESDPNAPHMAPFTNQDAAALEDGDAAILDTANDESVDVIAGQGSRLPVFVVPKKISGTVRDGSTEVSAKSIAASELGWMYAPGTIVPQVEVTGEVAVGEYLMTSATADKLLPTDLIAETDYPPEGACAIATEARADAGVISALLIPTNTVPRMNLAATTAPTVDDDVTLHYTVGSRWIDVTNDNSYECQDNTDGAAVWVQLDAIVGITKISDIEPSGAASVDVSSIVQTGGDILQTGFLVPADDAVQLYLRLNGEADGTDYGWAVNHTTSGGATAGTGDASDSEMQISGSANDIGFGAAEGIRFTIRIVNYAEAIASEFMHVTWEAVAFTSGGLLVHLSGGGALLSAEAVNQMTLLFSAGNLSGHVRTYTIGT